MHGVFQLALFRKRRQIKKTRFAEGRSGGQVSHDGSQFELLSRFGSSGSSDLQRPERAERF